MQPFEDHQDVICRLAYRVYTPLCLCFPMVEETSPLEITKKLTSGLERLSASFPWLAGKVVNDGSNPKIEPLNKFARLVIRDLFDDPSMPTMATLRKSKFPSRMLEGTMLTSLTGAPKIKGDEVAPVFFVQANFINGGLLLCFAGEHSKIDGHGMGQIIQLFSKACQNEPFTEEELVQGNRSRKDLIPLLDKASYKPGAELKFLIKTTSQVTPQPRKSTWTYFRFPAQCLADLKDIGSTPLKEGVAYITTDDAVSAFIWKSVCRARSSHCKGDTECTFARAVNVRSCLSIPPSFPGCLSNHTYTSLPLESVVSSALGPLSSSLRSALDPPALKYAVRSLATMLTLAPGKVAYGSGMDFSIDLFFSSWAGLPCYNLDFALGLRLPECVRRPEFMAIEGLIYLMPKQRNGDVDAAICLCDEDLEFLKHDREFRLYAQLIE